MTTNVPTRKIFSWHTKILMNVKKNICYQRMPSINKVDSKRNQTHCKKRQSCHVLLKLKSNKLKSVENHLRNVTRTKNTDYCSDNWKCEGVLYSGVF